MNVNLSSSLHTALSGMAAAVNTVNQSAENILDATTLNSFDPALETTSATGSTVTGMTASSNVSYANGLDDLQSIDNVTQDIINMKLAENTYKANIQTIKTVNSMTQKLLDTVS